MGRLQRRHVPIRAGDDRRHHLDDRRRRADAGRRDRLPHARVRAVVRQPALGRRGHRGRPVRARERATRTTTCSGRCAAAAATSASSRRSSSSCIRSRTSTAARCSTSSTEAENILRVLPRLHRGRARGDGRRSRRSRSRRRCRSSPRIATATRSSRSWRAGPGPLEQGETAFKPFRDVAPGRRRNGRADAVPGAQQRVRRAVPDAALQHYWKASFVKELTDEAIAAHLAARPGGARS